MSYISLVLLICLLAGCNLFFSVSAIALRIFSRVKLQQAFGSKNRQALVNILVAKSENLILTCSLFRLICNILTSLLLLAVFIKLSEGNLSVTDYVIVFVIALFIFMVFSLAIPHAWAKYAGEKVISRTYKLLMALAKITWPIVFIYKFIDTFVRRLAGVVEVTPEEHKEKKQEEFLNGLKQRKMEGVVDEEEQLMIENVLELSETTAAEIMTPRTDIVAVEVNSNLKNVLETITSAGHSRVPVYEENIDKIVGLIYAKDLLGDIGQNKADFNLSEKIRQAYFVPETKFIRELLHEFQNQKLHIAIVLDEYGGTAGIVTLEDIIEELVGEITDEYEKKPPEPIKQIDENTIEVDARTYVDDLNNSFGLNIPEDEDYDTIGGFVLSHLGYIPKTGASFDYENLKFSICSAEARRIKVIRITKTGEDKNAQ